MTIKKIRISKIRGIDSLEIKEKIFKNKPNILVAPNGFGKSSIACAFKFAADQTSLKIPDDERFKHKKPNQGHLEITVSDGNSMEVLSVTEVAHSNEIRKKYDIEVVSDLRKIKAINRNYGGFSRADAKEVIEPIILTKKVKNVVSPYKITNLKQEFGKYSSELENLSNSLFLEKYFLMRSHEFMDLIKKVLRTVIPKDIEDIKSIFETSNDKLLDIYDQVTKEVDLLSAKKENVLNLLNIIIDSTKYSKTKAFLCLWQILTVSKQYHKELSDHLEYLRYRRLKDSISNLLNDLNTSWKSTAVRETGGNLIIDIPDPTSISNGQRDVLCLVGMLFKARFFLKKKRAIIIIDEVFDYLDDANIVVGQYFISQIINDFKEQGRDIYPIILTHLNPSFFRNYVFKDQKVIYLEGKDINDSIDAMKKLISIRSDNSYTKDLKDKIAKYLVHYNTDNYDFRTELQPINKVRSSWGKKGKFESYIKSEYEKYIVDEKYDPLAICAITRRSVEELAFNQISLKPDANDFFTTHKTINKLNWAASQGAKIPEAHYLLRIIFDDGLHWRNDRDNTIPIVAKLSNPIIKNMIRDVVQSLDNI